MLCDFGLTRVEDSVTSVIAGGRNSLLYMSPEGLLNASYTVQGDVWAWGALFLLVSSDISLITVRGLFIICIDHGGHAVVGGPQ